MTLRLFNTLSRETETFTPIEPNHVRMYVCGMTIYDLCHVGHARMMMAFDVVYRWLCTLGYDVTYHNDCEGPWNVWWRQNFPGHQNAAWDEDGRPRALVYFEILEDGGVRNIRVVRSSGNRRFDFAVSGAIETAGNRGAFGPLPEAYRTLLEDIVRGDQTLFVHAHEVEAAWERFAPLLDAKIPVHFYSAGTWSPPEADRLIRHAPLHD